jgi:hypothetical protein
MSEKRLSKGEKKVISAYNGSVKETAENVKMSYGYVRNVVTLPYIIDAIQARENSISEKEARPLIADRQERQAFWASVMRGDPQVVDYVEKLNNEGKVEKDADGNPVIIKLEKVSNMKDRLKAAELLGKSNADFVDKVHHLGLQEGVPKEITDDMDDKQATNTYLDLVKSPTAGTA